MSTIQVVDDLVDVRFYTPLDPYYYSVDNRPLEDLNTNILLIAEASDAAAGGGNRAAMAGASAGYASSGYGEVVGGDPYRQGQGVFVGTYELDGLSVVVEHGYLIAKVLRGGTPSYYEPVMAVHDAVFSFSPQLNRGGIVQVKRRPSTSNDRVPSENSTIEVAEVSWLQGTSPGVFPLPDPGAVTLMKIDVPAGATEILPSYIELVNTKTIAQSASPIDSADIAYVSYLTTLQSGQSAISLNGSEIVPEKIDAVEVFADGVNQFSWVYNSAQNQIVLNTPVTDATEIRVRQTIIRL